MLTHQCPRSTESPGESLAHRKDSISPPLVLTRGVSGSQTGVDRAALDAARETGIPIGRGCPPGRVCENATIPTGLPLTETPAERNLPAPKTPRALPTVWTVRDARAAGKLAT